MGKIIDLVLPPRRSELCTITVFPQSHKHSHLTRFLACAILITQSRVKRCPVKSCGCLKDENTAKRFTIHGAAAGGRKISEYEVWCAMKQRCNNEKNKGYVNYGGRGIKVVERWNVFANFISDMGLRPTANHSIERKDNNGPYSPENCHWATRREQNLNNRANRMITYGGETMALSQWAERLGIKYFTLHHRLRKGWSDEQIIETPLGVRPRK